MKTTYNVFVYNHCFYLDLNLQDFAFNYQAISKLGLFSN